MSYEIYNQHIEPSTPINDNETSEYGLSAMAGSPDGEKSPLHKGFSKGLREVVTYLLRLLRGK